MNASLSTRRYRMIRNLNFLLLGYKCMPHYGGLTDVLNELEITKAKICSWEKMKSKLKAMFLPSSYIQDSYAHLNHLTQGSISMDDYTREFEKLLIKCEIQEIEEQTIVRHLGGLDPRYVTCLNFNNTSRSMRYVFST